MSICFFLVLMSYMIIDLSLGQDKMYISDAYVSVTSTGDFRDDDISLAYDNSNTTCAVGHSEQTTSIMFRFKGPRFFITSVCIVSSPYVYEDLDETNTLEVSWGTEERMMECIPSPSARDRCTYTCPGSGTNLFIAQKQGKELSVCNVIITRHVDDDMDPCDDTYNPNNYVGIKRCSSIICHKEDREGLVYVATMSFQGNRFEDSACAMKKLSNLGETLSQRELLFLSNAYIKASEEILTAWNSIGFENDYKLKFQSELQSICNDMFKVLNDRLIPMYGSQRDSETEVILLTIQAEFQALAGQFRTELIKKTYMASSLSTYTKAAVYAKKLRPSNNIRLLFTTSLSEFHILLGDKTGSCKLLQTALSDAKADIMNDTGVVLDTSLMKAIHNRLEKLSCENQPEDTRRDL